MVSDYKFHLFCKRLKKEKWRLGKDLSLAMMLMIFHCCLRMSHPWEPGVGCTGLPARSLSPGSPQRLQSSWHPYRHRHGCSCLRTPSEELLVLPSPRALHVCTLAGSAPRSHLPPGAVYGLQGEADSRRARNLNHFGAGMETASACGQYYLFFPFKCQKKMSKKLLA